MALSSLSMTMSCDEEEQHGQTVRTIVATIEQSSTRTALDGPDADGVYKTIWSSEDAITVFSGNDSATKFKLTSGANTNTAEFEGNAASDNMVAVYPYSIVKGRTGSTISVALPEFQEYVSGNIPQGAYPMAAVSDGAILPFYNLCSVLRLRMFGDLTVYSITFTPNDATIKTSGNATVNAGDKMLTMSGDAKSTVRLNCANGVKLTKTNTDFLMVVPAQKYTGGFTITISTDQGEVTTTVKSDVTLSRSVLYPVKTFECKIDDSKDNIVFEDANFKAYLVANFDKNGDREINHEEAREITSINVSTENIASVSGIEYMTNLETLICRGTYKDENVTGLLTTIDVTQNKKLTTLNVEYNVLTSIDISNNTKLTELSFRNNKLTTIDAGNNVSLIKINGNGNKLETIILPQSKSLAVLSVKYNKLKSLDVTRNEGLDSLECDWNSLSELDLSRNTSLVYLNCQVNKLKTLDLSHNTKLEDLLTDTNYDLAMLDVSKCIKLKTLVCSCTSLRTLDISRCTELMTLDCRWSGIEELTLPPSTSLYKLLCCSNDLKSLDISANTGLKTLDCSDNQIKSLDVSKNTALNDLDCSSNKIETLDISKLTDLKKLYCDDNPLVTLYIFKGQLDGLTEKDIPDGVKIIGDSTTGGNEDTKTGDKFTLE